MAITEVSRLLYGDVVDDEDYVDKEQSRVQFHHYSNSRDQDIISSPSSHDTTFSQPEQAKITSEFQPAESSQEVDTESQNGSLLRCNTPANTDANHLSLGESATTVETNDHVKELGKWLFEEDRKSRNSFIAKIQEDLKKKEMSMKVNVLEDNEGSSRETSQDNQSSLEGHPLDETQGGDSGKNDPLPCDTKQVLDFDELGKGSLSPKELAVMSSNLNVQAHDEDRRAIVLPTSGEVTKDDRTHCISASNETERTREPTEIHPQKRQDELTKTEQVNSTPNCNVEIHVLTEATVESESKREIQFSDQSQTLKNQKRSDLQSVQRISAQGEDLDTMERDIDEEEAGEDCSTEERYAKNDSSSVTPEKERVSEASMGQTCPSLLTKTSTSPSGDGGGDKNFTEGGWDQYLSNFSTSATDRGLWNDRSGGKEENYSNYSKAIEDNVDLYDGQSVPRMKTNFPLSFQDKNFTKGGWDQYLTNFSASATDRGLWNDRSGGKEENYSNYSKAIEDNVDLHDGQSVPRMKTNFPLSFQGGNVFADGGETLGFFNRNQQIVPESTVTSTRLKTGELHLSGSQMQLEASDEVDGPANAFRAVMPPDFGGARPKTTRKFDASVIPVSTYQSENRPIGLDPQFLERHSVVNNSHHSFLGHLNCDGSASKDSPKEGAYDPHFSATYRSSINNSESSNISGKDFLQQNNNPTSTCQRPRVNDAFGGGSSNHGYSKSLVDQEKLNLQEGESWHFPPLPITAKSYVQARQYQPTRFCDDENSSQGHDPLFNSSESRDAYCEMVSLTNEVNSRSTSCVDSAFVSAGKNQTHLTAATDISEDSDEDSFLSHLARLKDAMIKNVRLLASSGTIENRIEPEPQPMEKVGIQEQSQVVEENEHSALVSETNSNQQEAIPQQNNQDSTDAVEEVQNAPVQETPRPVCSHYQRRCLVSFPCCKKFYPCHRCHNDANDCTEDQARAINATHIRCTICYHEQEVRS